MRWVGCAALSIVFKAGASVWLLLSHSSLYAASPECQIILIENFISPAVANALIRYYDDHKTNLSLQSDNQIAGSAIANPEIQKILSDISDEILNVMRHRYPLMSRPYRLDHSGLYARIPGNTCSYHADNVSFICPVHGSDQGRLRTTCMGTCPGAKYVPNHTPNRDYTALLYLNENFEGGEIVFEDGPCNRQYKKKIPIRANLLVLSPNGPDYYHEVLMVRKGKRYSAHFWYRYH